MEEIVQHFDMPDPQKAFKVISLLFLGFLTCLIIFFALVSHADEPQVTPPRGGATPTTLQDIDVTEQAVPLVDGRTVLCLVFTSPNKQITCDWATARAR